ncbi:hypothetical protein PoB_007372300 [Plakobranchus ocellatus]|uniref:Uncharacterized protein n=1 Tax=Plakobranchus ocellatus TaxID=259542 RepID=A0AAV4DSB8_9GAST|nr:hypothetical protein PoB_007372300 [Plakobranchus ocellatus]
MHNACHTPLDMQRPFCCGFEPRHRRPGLKEGTENLISPCCALAFIQKPNLNRLLLHTAVHAVLGSTQSEIYNRSLCVKCWFRPGEQHCLSRRGLLLLALTSARVDH